MAGLLMAQSAVRWRCAGSALLPGALRRGVMAGTAWGLITGAVVIAAGAWECGGLCLPDAALTVAFSLAAGLATIGPLAAFGARQPRPEEAPRRAAAN